jgi:Na+/glutamate symporter
MPTDRVRIERRTLLRAGLIAGQWLLLTIALGAVIVRTERTFEGLIAPRYDSSSVFIAAFLAALLLGITISSPRALAAAVALLCSGANGLFILLLYIPAWEGTILRTRALDNFALDRALVVPLLMTLPASIGALGGWFLGAAFSPAQEVFPPDRPENHERSWWSQRSGNDGGSSGA